MKTLRFFEPLPDLILNGTKDTTWRIKDDKDLKKGDLLSLIDRQRNEFAQAQVLWTRQTTFANLSKKDLEGHEPFESIEKMLRTYSEYYGIDATLDTPLKVIKFKLLKTTA